MSAEEQVWCHSCSEVKLASHDSGSGELQCQSCNSSFVEKLDQGIEEFRGAGNDNQNNRPSEDASRDEIIQYVMSRLLGIPSVAIRNPNQPRVVSLVQPMGRQSGIIIRQGGATPADFISMLGDGPAVTDGESAGQGDGRDASVRGILGLLGAFAGREENSGLDQLLHHILMNENSYAGAPPASEECINNLDRQTMQSDTEAAGLGECSITQEAYVTGDVVVTLPCEHNFKEEAIVHWLKMHNTCPVCRVEVERRNN